MLNMSLFRFTFKRGYAKVDFKLADIGEGIKKVNILQWYP